MLPAASDLFTRHVEAVNIFSITLIDLGGRISVTVACDRSCRVVQMVLPMALRWHDYEAFPPLTFCDYHVLGVL